MLSARWRNPTVFMVPHGTPRSMQQALDEVFAGGSCFDFSNPGPAFCPFCLAFPHADCTWEFIPWSLLNAPDRVFLASAAVDHDSVSGFPPTASVSILLAVEYFVVYLISGGNHFVSQLRLQGVWLKYDCLLGGSTVRSMSFDDSWNSGNETLYVYMRTTLVIPLVSEDEDVAIPPTSQYSSVPFVYTVDSSTHDWFIRFTFWNQLLCPSHCHLVHIIWSWCVLWSLLWEQCAGRLTASHCGNNTVGGFVIGHRV